MKAGISRQLRFGHMCWLLAGLTVLAVALGPPLEPLSERLFAAHMAQHMLLATLAPPLLVLGIPKHPFARALRGHGRAVASLVRRAGVRDAWRFITRPAVACGLHAVAIWLWHAPTMYDAAIRHDLLHALEHANFLGTGVLLWWSILRPSRARGRSREGLAVGMVVLFATTVQTGALGALLALSRRVLYTTPPGASTPWGLSALDDQHLAGLLMWVPGSVLYLIMMSILFVAWVDEPDRRRAGRVAITAAAAGFVITGCGRGGARSVPRGDPERGRAAIAAAGCGACHAISGVPGADGDVGPPLAGLARRAIIGGVLSNTPENMTAWLEDPPAYAPRTTMPNLGLSPSSARDIAAYLYSLK